jgi:S-formylglutathione hydrolase FrmB
VQNCLRGSNSREHDILDHRLEWRRQADNIAFPISQKRYSKLIRQQSVFDLAGIPLTLRMREGYDHSYYFISTFMADHIAWHAGRPRR